MGAPEDSTTRFDLDRTIALSDGVFAIALTLLVLDISLPGQGSGDLWDQFDDLLPQIEAYALSFAVIGLLWLRHHEFFGQLRAVDHPLTALNLLYLGLLALIPFPTRVLADHNDEPAAVVLYASVIAAITIVGAFQYRHAARHGLFAGPAPLRSRASYVANPLIFLVSIPIAFVTPVGAEMFWASLIVLGRITSARGQA